ncbi:MAG: hypothetical protein FWD53_03070, partial [Phycisphaerales bacterium]|nr:hypothetical protein [Phycisphaerales bacterium]
MGVAPFILADMDLGEVISVLFFGVILIVPVVFIALVKSFILHHSCGVTFDVAARASFPANVVSAAAVIGLYVLLLAFPGWKSNDLDRYLSTYFFFWIAQGLGYFLVAF